MFSFIRSLFGFDAAGTMKVFSKTLSKLEKLESTVESEVDNSLAKLSTVEHEVQERIATAHEAYRIKKEALKAKSETVTYSLELAAEAGKGELDKIKKYAEGLRKILDI